jgi:hypothetical protein
MCSPRWRYALLYHGFAHEGRGLDDLCTDSKAIWSLDIGQSMAHGQSMVHGQSMCANFPAQVHADVGMYVQRCTGQALRSNDMEPAWAASHAEGLS